MSGPEGTVPRRVYWILAAGLLAISFSPILVRVADEAPPSVVAVWRTLLSVLFLLPFAMRRSLASWRTHDAKAWTLIALAGVLLGFHFVAWIASIHFTSVASASVLFTTNPLIIALLGFVLLGERLKRPIVVAILVSVAGASMIGFGDMSQQTFPDATLGNGLAVSAAALFAGYLLVGRVARQTSDWLAYVFPLYVVVVVTTVVFALVEGVTLTGYSWVVYVACALMALGPQILGHGSLNYAVRYIPAAVLGLLGLVEPVLSTVWAWMLFGEVPSALSLGGMVLILASLPVVYLPNRNLSAGSSENRFRPRRK